MDEPKTIAETYKVIRDFMAAQANPPPKWDLLGERLQKHSADLRRAIDEFGETLPPGSMVAVRREPSPMPTDNVLRISYTLRPVFRGQPCPGDEWTVYAKRESAT